MYHPVLLGIYEDSRTMYLKDLLPVRTNVVIRNGCLSTLMHLHFILGLKWVEKRNTHTHTSQSCLSRFSELTITPTHMLWEDSHCPPESKCHFNKCPLKSTYVQVLCCGSCGLPWKHSFLYNSETVHMAWAGYQIAAAVMDKTLGRTHWSKTDKCY